MGAAAAVTTEAAFLLTQAHLARNMDGTAMKPTLIAAAVLAVVLSAQGEDTHQRVEYFLEGKGETVWRNALEKVNEQKRADQRKAGEEKTSVTIFQHVERGRYLAHLNRSGKEEELVSVLLADDMHQDGARLLVELEDTGRLYEYESTANAKKRVREMREAGMAGTMALEDFIERLQQGQIFEYMMKRVAGCRWCGGAGSVERGVDRRTESCMRCGGDGKDTHETIYVLRWKKN